MFTCTARAVSISNTYKKEICHTIFLFFYRHELFLDSKYAEINRDSSLDLKLTPNHAIGTLISLSSGIDEAVRC